MRPARMHTAILTSQTGQVRRVLVAVREVLPGHLVYNPPITLQAGETLRFDPPLEMVIGQRPPDITSEREHVDGEAESS